MGATALAGHELGGHRDATSAGTGSGTSLGSGVRDPHGPESWQHQHVGHGHEFEGDPCDSGAPLALPHFTAGPHITDTANRLDPHVVGGVLQGSTGTGHHGHHGHQDTSAGTGVGSTGTGVGSTGTGIGSTGTGIGSGTSGTGAGISSTSGGLDLSSKGYGDSRSGTQPKGTDYDSQRGDYHLGRDATLAGGAGAIGAGAYEVGKDQPISTSGPAPNTSGPHKFDILNKLDPRVKETTMSSTTGNVPRDELPSSGTTGRDHHYGRDAGLAGAGGVAAYEAEKHHKKHEVPQQVSGHDSTVGGTQPAGYDQPPPVGRTGTTGSGHHYGRDAGLVGAGGVAAYEAEKHHNKHDVPQHLTGRDSTVTGTQPPGYDQTGHHYGRDAGLVGAGGAAAYEGEKHLGHDRTGTSSYPEDRHAGRDTAIAGGAGAAGGAEFSKKDAEKQAATQQKAIVKEEKREEKAEHKHEKALQKEHEKEEKKHEKAFLKEHEKEEKKHEKLLHKQQEKEEKAVQKEQSKEEKHDGKKHGLFSFLHREKPDAELKEEEAARQAQLHGHAGNVSTVAGVAVAEDEYGHHKLHKDPPPGYAAAPQSGYASQVTGGTGTTALAQGDPVQRGSHISGVGNKLDPK